MQDHVSRYNLYLNEHLDNALGILCSIQRHSFFRGTAAMELHKKTFTTGHSYLYVCIAYIYVYDGKFDFSL